MVVINKSVTFADNDDRPYLKFILNGKSAYMLFDTGNPIDHISLTKSISEIAGIKDGSIIPITLPGVGSIQSKAFIEDRGASLIQPLHFNS